jgi:CDGSH-type Zn-finger protein/uncharacterized Fe-S cluster protein YjdI
VEQTPHKVHRYSNGEVTVIWKPNQCIHSTNCWRQLHSVFDPGKRPWINIEGGTTQQIIDQVKKCPSGALSYEMNGGSINEESTPVETNIEVQPNGPLLVYGRLNIKDRFGNETTKEKTTAFCRCGSSGNKPYCDGSHRRINFNDENSPGSFSNA